MAAKIEDVLAAFEVEYGRIAMSKNENASRQLTMFMTSYLAHMDNKARLQCKYDDPEMWQDQDEIIGQYRDALVNMTGLSEDFSPK